MTDRNGPRGGVLPVAVVLVLAAAALFFWSGRKPGEPPAVESSDLRPGPASPLPEPGEFESPLRERLEAALAAVEARAGEAQAWGDLAMLCHAHGLHEEALHVYRVAEDLDPGDSLWPHLRGIVCDVLSLPDEAAAAFARSIEMEPYDAVSRCALARIHQGRGDDDNARRLFLEVIKMRPKSVAARVGLGQLAARAGALDAAAGNLQQALEEYPRCGPAHAALARVYERQGKAKAAEFHRRWSLVCGSRIPLPDPYMERVESLGVTHTARFKQGRLAAEQGRWKDAAEHFRAALELRGELVEARYFLGVSLLRSGDLEAGLKELETVASMEGREVDAWLLIARTRAARAEIDKAREAVAAALKAAPGSAEAHVARGDLHRREGNDEAAMADYDRAITLEPGHAPAHVARGELLHIRRASREDIARDVAVLERERARASAAVQAFERALELQADLAAAYAGAGRSRMQIREFTVDEEKKAHHLQAAIEHFRALVRYFPRRKSSHVALIRALYAAGLEKEMVAAIRKAAELWPADPQFRKRASSPVKRAVEPGEGDAEGDGDGDGSPENGRDSEQ